MGFDPLTISAIAGIIGAGNAVYQGQQQQKQADKASRQAQKSAADAAKQAEMDMNRANQKTPDSSALLAAAQQGQGSSTMLTGSQGVDPGQLSLGKSTLLGM